MEPLTSRGTVNWVGESGKTYTYNVYDGVPGTGWSSNGGNYIFAKNTANGWVAVYIGQTNNLSERLQPSHEKVACAERNGATHTHAHTQSNAQTRLDEETDLVRRYKPVCNG